jgi:subtilase family serine protease
MLLFITVIKKGVWLMRAKIFLYFGIIFLLSAIMAGAAVDLKFSTAISQSPDPATVGSTVTFTVTFKNFGGAVDNLKITGGVDGVGIFERIYAHINADLPRTDTFTWTATAGAHTVWFELDPNHVQGDSDYSNNRTEKQITVNSSQNSGIQISQAAMDNIIANGIPPKRKPVPVILKPNLKPEITFDAEGLKCGGMINFKIKIKNTGNKVTPTGFNGFLYSNDSLVSNILFSPLEAGQMSIFDSGDALLLCKPDCTSTWKFVLDPENIISESNEEDNSWQIDLNCECP